MKSGISSKTVIAPVIAPVIAYTGCYNGCYNGLVAYTAFSKSGIAPVIAPVISGGHVYRVRYMLCEARLIFDRAVCPGLMKPTYHSKLLKNANDVCC